MAYDPRDPKVEVRSLMQRHPPKGIDPTIPASERERLMEERRQKMFEEGEKAHKARTLAKGGSVTRADGCCKKGRTKGRMI